MNRKASAARAFRTGEVARIVGVSPGRVRSWARAGFCQPERHGRHLEFTFQDLVLLRTARALLQARVPGRRVQRALRELARQVPPDYPLSALRIHAEGRDIVVRDGQVAWQPESGQTVFRFDIARLARSTGHVVDAKPRNQPSKAPEEKARENALVWFERALAAEEDDPRQACLWYRKAIHEDSSFADPYVNLGRLIHQAGDTATAIRLYREALGRVPDDPIGRYNLALALEDEGDLVGASEQYRAAIQLDGEFADAHFNLARLLEELGHRTEAAEHFLSYVQLTGGE